MKLKSLFYFMSIINESLKNLTKINFMNASIQIEFKIKLRIENINFCCDIII